MSNMHTPGPWPEIHPLHAIGWHPLSKHEPNALKDAAAEALEAICNCRLMTAAPDLLDALKEIVEYTGGADSALDDEYVMERIHAAINKAEGE